MILYRANTDDHDVQPPPLIAAEHTTARYQSANALRSIRELDQDIHVQTQWKGLPDHSDMTWEPLVQVLEDVPGMPQGFQFAGGKRSLKKRAVEFCSFDK